MFAELKMGSLLIIKKIFVLLEFLRIKTTTGGI